jgi:hypothetical protein
VARSISAGLPEPVWNPPLARGVALARLQIKCGVLAKWRARYPGTFLKAPLDAVAGLHTLIRALGGAEGERACISLR